MSFVLPPWQLLVAILSGRVNLRQQEAIDFTTIEVWTKCGLVTYYVLFVMKLATVRNGWDSVRRWRRLARRFLRTRESRRNRK